MTSPSTTTYDALVVGAGPAGAHVAYLLARTGRRVALLDKARFPRDKVCGGGLSRKAIALLDLDLGPLVQARLRGAFLTFRGRATIVKDPTPAPGCTVLRSELDQALLARACAAGARFFGETALDGVRLAGDGVAARTSRGELRGRRLFAADGVASAVRAQLFGRHAVAYVPALEALVRVPDADRESLGERAVFDFGAVPHGYGWIFPKRDHLNVGVYSPFGARALRRHLEDFMRGHPALRRRTGVAFHGFAIPVANPLGAYERGPVALLGDAAGLAEPVFGEGIYFALKSAELAAQAELERRTAAAPASYTERVARELLPELRAAAWLARLLFAFPAFTFRHVVCNDRVNDLFAGVITGTTGYRECLRKTLLAAPRWLFRSGPPPDFGRLEPG